jgi:oligopeptide transport system substrate-binding protein
MGKALAAKTVFRIILAVIMLGVVIAGALGVFTETPGETPPDPGTSDLPHSGTLNLYGGEPWTLDPAVSGEMLSHEYIIQVFGGLVRLDDNLLPTPDIASRWEVSGDGTVYTFYLREGTLFHDGRAVTAADFKYAWERACDPATGSGTAATYLGDIVGAAEILAGTGTELAGVRVIDDLTLEVTIDAPRNYFLSKLSYPTAFVVDEKNVAEGGEWWRQPNGTGPFRLKEWDAEEAIVLERWGKYYGLRARVDSVHYQFLTGRPINLYETGEIDVCQISSAYIDKAADPAGVFAGQLMVVPVLSFSYVGFNAAAPPFDDPDVRRAFTMAVDKEKIIALIYRDMVATAGGILPPGMPGFNENLASLPYDPEAAREILIDKYGGIDAMPEVIFTAYGTGGLVSSVEQALIVGWKESLGVDIKVRQVETELFFYHTEEEIDSMYTLGWVADYPHPQNFLEVLFGGDSASNSGGYLNPAVDELLARAGVEQDYDTMIGLYRQAEQLLVDDGACIPLAFGQDYYLVRGYVSDYIVNGQGLPQLNRVIVGER